MQAHSVPRKSHPAPPRTDGKGICRLHPVFTLVLEADLPVRARTVLQHSHTYSYNMGSDQAQGSTLGYAALKALGDLT